MPQKIFQRILDPECLKADSTPRPLVAFVESCYGPVDCDAAIAALGSEGKAPYMVQHIRSLTNWFRLQHMVSDGYAHLLREEQRNSYRLLFDWWTAAYDLPIVALVLFAELRIMLQEYPQFDLVNEHDELVKCAEKHYNEFHYYSRHNKALGGFESDYNKALTLLFKGEFTNTYDRISENKDNCLVLHLLRVSAAREAYYQQASLHCSQIKSGSSKFRHESLFPKLPSKRTAGAGYEYSWVASVEASDPSFPQTLDRGPRVAVCPWLKDKNEDPLGLDGWPEYLWHLNDRRLVRLRDLGSERPAYTAISHTWGRWTRKDGYLIPNGMKYRVPLNGLFDVKTLPQTLQRLAAKIDTDYVWLDLVCIPQGCKGDTLDWEHSALKKQEVSRQGSIFRNAKRAIAWLHNVYDFSAFEGFARLAALSMVGVDEVLKKKTKRQRERRKVQALRQVGENPTGWLTTKLKSLLTRTKPQSDRFSSAIMAKATSEVNVWFTSLWTLQEVSLRPDMWLATAEWDFLSLDESTRLPLNGLLSICYKYYEESTEWDDTQQHVFVVICQLLEWEKATGLGKLMTLHQIDILRLGERRYCKWRRSEAIMSVVGATLWYEEVMNGQYDPESDLILGKYCTKFIDELRDLIPADFYTAYTKSKEFKGYQQEFTPFECVNGEDIVRNYRYPDIGSPVVSGSLIPFSKMKHQYTRNDAIGPSNVKTHDSVHSWIINSLGQITIKRACILASSRLKVPKGQTPIQCKFEGFLPTALEDRDENIERTIPEWRKAMKLMTQPDLQEWARTRPFVVHLVVVSAVQESFLGFTPQESDTMIRGIVLRDVDEDLNDLQGPRKLVSIGTFWGSPKRISAEKTVEIPAERAVDWIVL